jgi:hypothetical protein
VTTGRRPRRLRWWQPAAVAAAAVLTVALTQNTTGAVFTAQTADTGNQVSAAASFCTAPGSTTLSVTNDTWVDQANPTTANGGAPGLTVRSFAGANGQALLRFTLPALPSQCHLTAATLRLHATSSQGPGTIEVSRASTTWTSAAATWNMASRPAPAGTPVGTAAGTAGWHAWTVTVLVTALYAGPNEGFLVKDRIDDAAVSRSTVYESLDSPTTANRPQLVLTWG